MRWWLAVCLLLCGLQPVLAQPSPSHVVLLSTPLVSPAGLARLQGAAAEAGLALQVVSAARDTPETLAAALKGARLLVIDAPHASVAQAAAARFGEMVARSGTPYVLIGEFGLVAKGQALGAAPLSAERGVDPAWAQRLRAYWRFSGAANIASAMTALGRVGDMAGLPPPVELPLAGFYHPG